MAVDLSERRVKVWLLYLKHMRGDRGRLNLNIIREVCSFLHLPPNLLVDVTNSYIRFFDFQKGTWKQKRTLKPHIQVDGEVVGWYWRVGVYSSVVDVDGVLARLQPM